MKVGLNKTLNRILHIWLAYVAVSCFLLCNPNWHWPTLNLYAIINYSLYFLSFLLSITIFRLSRHNRFTFLNFAIVSLLFSVGIIHVLIGDDYLIGNNYWLYWLFPYRKLLLSVFIDITIAYIAFDYLFHDKPVWTKYGLTAAIVLPINFMLYYNFIMNKNYILLDGHFQELLLCNIEATILAFTFIGIYGLIYLKADNPIGEYVNSLIVLFFFYIVYDLYDGVFEYLGFSLPFVSKLVLTILLVIINIILFRKLKTTTSLFGKLYESLVFSEQRFNFRVKTKKNFVTVMLAIFKQYLRILPYRFFSILLIICSLSVFIWLFPERYEKRMLLAFGASFALLAMYILVVDKRKKLTSQYFKNNM